MTVTNSDAGSSLQSVDRALHVLELLAGWGSGGVSELAMIWRRVSLSQMKFE